MLRENCLTNVCNITGERKQQVFTAPVATSLRSGIGLQRGSPIRDQLKDNNDVACARAATGRSRTIDFPRLRANNCFTRVQLQVLLKRTPVEISSPFQIQVRTGVL